MFRTLPRIRLRNSKYNALRRRVVSRFRDELDPGRNPSIILPLKYAPRGVHHIEQKRVPEGILRPYYVTGGNSIRAPGLASIIPLGGEHETGIRAACKLARDALKLAESLVRVSERFMP